MTLPDRDDQVLLLHNPGCSKSRATKALLEERGIAFQERLYLEEPLTPDELTELARRLGRPIGGFVRPREAAWAEAGAAPDGPEEAVLGAVAAHPILLERPVVVRGGRAAIGRPPEAVLELFPG